MNTTPADHEAMSTAARQIEQKHHQIHTLQRKLQSQMMDLSTRWHGDTFARFESKYSRFDTEFERVKQGLDQLHTCLVESSNHRDPHASGSNFPGHQPRRFST